MTSTATTNLVAAARDIADTVLFPAAIEVDRSGRVADSHWPPLAEAGLYGLAAPTEFGGPGLADSAALLAARADGAELAVRAATALVAATGGPALTNTAPAQLLARNATFMVVAASRPELKQLLVNHFSS